jgi:hypothetical protein
LVITYFYAGVAKLSADWLLDAQPVKYFLSQPHVLTPYKPYLSHSQAAFWQNVITRDAFAYFISWSGMIFDISVGFLLLFRRTRLLGLGAMFFFHGLNHFLIFDDIGLFPLVGVLTSLIFLDPDWPKAFCAWLGRPRIPKPDWAWLVGGAIALPGIGALLGWKSGQGITPAARISGARMTKLCALFVLGWLAWQAVVPIRHYWVPGDARITFEGLPFSWRLKAEVYRAAPCEVFVDDDGLFEGTDDGTRRIRWSAWHGDKVVYRIVTNDRINWSELPEIVAILEPSVGERILFNPHASPVPVRSEAEARARLSTVWRELYGRAPGKVESTVTLKTILEGYVGALQKPGSGLINSSATARARP